MKVSREQAAQNRERILDVAAQLFREHGFAGIGVADLMKHAGFTHGGFYGHFASKEDLMAQASARALAQMGEVWNRRAERAEGDPLAAVVKAYLSTRHRDHPGGGCAVAALGAEAARQGPQVRHAVTAGLQAQIETLMRLMPGASGAEQRLQALVAYAGMVGALIISRIADDPKFSKEILQAVEASIPQPVAGAS